jgi:hypothetical protein
MMMMMMVVVVVGHVEGLLHCRLYPSSPEFSFLI